MNKRSRRGVDEWRKIVAAQPASGSSIAAYCRGRGISQPSFFAWRRRLANGEGAGFVEVRAAGAIEASEVRSQEAIEICLQGGRRLLVRGGFDHDLLIELVRVLEDVA